MKIKQVMKGIRGYIMTRVLTQKKKKDIPIIGKRRLSIDYSDYTWFSASASRPPISSPNLERKSEIKHSEKKRDNN